MDVVWLYHGGELITYVERNENDGFMANKIAEFIRVFYSIHHAIFWSVSMLNNEYPPCFVIFSMV